MAVSKELLLLAAASAPETGKREWQRCLQVNPHGLLALSLHLSLIKPSGQRVAAALSNCAGEEPGILYLKLLCNRFSCRRVGESSAHLASCPSWF